MSAFENDNCKESNLLPLTAMVLCGGRSKRMGRPKAFLPFQGATIISHIVGVLTEMFQRSILVSNEPESYEDLGVDVVKDILPYRGPMGGILSGLLTVETEYAFVIACDMPLLSKRLILDMAAARSGFDVVVLCHDDGIEPLFGIYSTSCIKPLEESLFAGNLSVQELIGGLRTTTFKYDRSKHDLGTLPSYFNINTPQDYSRLLTGGGSSTLRRLDQRK